MSEYIRLTNLLHRYVFVVICFLAAQPLFAQQPYRYDVIATSSASRSVFAAPSINNNGEVSFAGRNNPGGGGVFTDYLPNSPRDLLPGFSSQPFWNASGQLQINDSRQILSWWSNTSTSPIQDWLFTIDSRPITPTTTVIAAANGAGSFNDFDEIWPTGVTLGNGTLPVFQTRSGNNTSILSSGVRPNFTSRTILPSFGSGFRPMVSDNDTAVVRFGGDGNSPIVILDRVRLTDQIIPPINIATTAIGFSQIGQSPSISKNDEAIAFYADLNQAGATALGTNPGPGVFVSIKLANGQRKTVRIVGRLVEDNSAQGGNDDGICDPGETCVQGELGSNMAGSRIFFNSFDTNSRIDVAYIASKKPGIEDDLVMVSFIGTPNIASDLPGRTFSNQTGLWTQVAAITDNSGAVHNPDKAIPVAQIGDVISGSTLTGISVYDQMANNVNRVAFWASSNNGNMIIRAVHDPGTPVIFIAGIAGSELRKPSPDQKLWPPESTSSDLTPLAIGNPVKIPDVIRNYKTGVLGITEINDSIYTSLLDSLKNNGYLEYNLDGDESRRNSTCGGQDINVLKAKHPTLFVFPYDWRKSVADSTAKLAEYIQCVQQIYPDGDMKVNVVAHSMGGLLARRYILENQNTHHIKTLITIGSPWLGAPRAIHTLETGSFVGPAYNDTFAGSFKAHLANFFFAGQIKQIVEGFPGAHQLLPSERYFLLGGSPLNVNGVNYDFLQTKAWINSRHQSTNPGNQMSDFHDFQMGQQDDFRNATYGVNYYHIYGRQKRNKTVGGVENRTTFVVTQGGPATIDEVYPYETVGDGTVPLISSSRRIDSTDGLNATCGTPNDKRCINVCSTGDSVDDEDDAEHNGMTKNPQVQSQIRQILSFTDGLRPDNPSFETEDCVTGASLTSFESSESHYLTLTGIKDVAITDGQGNTNQAISTAYRLNVPGVSENVIGTNSEQIITPINNTYIIRFTGSGQGAKIENIRGVTNRLTDASYMVRYDDLVIPNGAVTELKIINNQVDSLKYDSNGDGTPDTVIPPSRVITDPQNTDLQPPQISVSWRGTRATVNLTDQGSGVRRMFVRLCISGDCSGTFSEIAQSTYSVVGTSFTSGIEVVSEDNAGNRSNVILYPKIL